MRKSIIQDGTTKTIGYVQMHHQAIWCQSSVIELHFCGLLKRIELSAMWDKQGRGVCVRVCVCVCVHALELTS